MELDFCDGDLLPVEDGLEECFEIDGDYLLPIEEDFGSIWEEGRASRFFKIGDRVKVYYKNKIVHGEVVDKYSNPHNPKLPPRFLMRTDEKISDNSNSFLGGFGLEGSLKDVIGIRFENEPDGGDRIFGYYRLMTVQDAWDECQPLEYLE